MLKKKKWNVTYWEQKKRLKYDIVENLEVSDMDVYWTVLTPLINS